MPPGLGSSPAQPLTCNLARGKLIRILKATRQEYRILANKVSTSKYRGLPLDTPVPEYKRLLGQQWHVWCWWAGHGGVSGACEDLSLDGQGKMRAGPPISYEYGWDIHLPHHRAALLELYNSCRPQHMTFAPTCAPWSNSSNTMDPELKEQVRIREISDLSFMCSIMDEQFKRGFSYTLEQPRSSEMLKLPMVVALGEKHGAVDWPVDMCQHGLKDPENGMPSMKPTVLRSCRVTHLHTSKECPRTHAHQHLQGWLKNGMCRTAFAQRYTKDFCRSLAKDIRKSILRRDSHEAFPAARSQPSNPGRPDPNAPNTDDEQEIDKVLDALDDPYWDNLPRWTRQEGDQPQDERAAPPTPARPRPGIDYQEPQPKRKPAPAPAPGTPPQVPPPDDEPAAAPEDAVAVPDVAGDGAIAVPRPANATRPLLTEDGAQITDLFRTAAPRTGDGGVVWIQTGNRLSILQELFGTPNGIIIRVGILARRPNQVPEPEPVIAAADVPRMMVVTKASDQQEQWTLKPWFKTNRSARFPKKPAYLLVLYGRERTDGDLADHIRSAPLDEIADLRGEDQQALDLPVVLRKLAEGDAAEKTKLLLTLHEDVPQAS